MDSASFARQCSVVISGNLVASLANIVPDGLLVFFPSYFMLETCIEHWKSGGGPFANCYLIIASLCIWFTVMSSGQLA